MARSGLRGGMASNVRIKIHTSGIAANGQSGGLEYTMCILRKKVAPLYGMSNQQNANRLMKINVSFRLL